MRGERAVEARNLPCDANLRQVVRTEGMATKSKKAPYTLDQARQDVLEKLRGAGAKGGSPPAAKTEPKRSLLLQAVEELETERAIFADRTVKKPKFFLIEFAPTAESVAGKIEQLAALKHPELLGLPELKKAAKKLEQTFFAEAIQQLESSRRLLKLRRKTAALYAHGESLRGALGEARNSAPSSSAPFAEQAVRKAYRELLRDTGFPDVEISALQAATGAPMEPLKEWLRAEHRHGRAVFGLGDWSLASEQARAGVIELRGDRYLVVRLEE
jgi:hypothetical protein